MHVRIFVSSELRDTAVERACLREVILPKLRRWGERRGLVIELVDGCEALGEGGAGEDEAAVLAKNLPAIDKCRPFFLGLIGSRYGRPVGTLPDEVAERYPDLLIYEGRSRLELEFRHALGAVPAGAAGMLFFVRSPDFLDGVPPEHRDRFPAEDPVAAERLAMLKEAVRQAGRPVSEYRCGWDDRAMSLRLERFEDAVIAAVRDAIVEWQASAAGVTDPAPSPHLPPAPSEPAAVPDYEKVQFTVYRPRTVRPAEWFPMLAFAHRKARRPDARDDEPDPVEQVRALAIQSLGSRAREYRDTTTDSSRLIPQEGELTFLPDVPGVEFDPGRRVFRWIDDVHSEEFRLRASPDLDGKTADGHLAVYHGGILIARVGLSIRVDRAYWPAGAPAADEPASARPYRKIFASYSHRDTEIVRQFEAFARSLGDEYLRDVIHLRAGEVWGEQITRMIDEADVFQLFWSSNSIASEYVRREWEYALSLNRPYFVRPTYWESPLPETPGPPPLPPEDLRRLHFHYIAAAVAGASPGLKLGGLKGAPGAEDSDSDSEFELTLDDSGDSGLEHADVDLADVDLAEEEDESAAKALKGVKGRRRREEEEEEEEECVVPAPAPAAGGMSDEDWIIVVLLVVSLAAILGYFLFIH